MHTRSTAEQKLDEHLTLDLRTLAALLGTSPAALRNAASEGSLPFPLLTLGGRKLFARSADVRAHLSAASPAASASDGPAGADR